MLFKVALVSSDASTHGVPKLTLLARSGETWQVLDTSASNRQPGDTLDIDPDAIASGRGPDGPHSFSDLGLLYPMQLFANAPPDLVELVWSLPVPQRSPKVMSYKGCRVEVTSTTRTIHYKGWQIHVQFTKTPEVVMVQSPTNVMHEVKSVRAAKGFITRQIRFQQERSS